jgi:hypothetical protein
MLRLAVSLLSVIALAGCAVVDLAAHGVKRYEKTKEQEQTAGASGQQSAAAETSRNDEPMRDVGYGASVEPASSGGAIQSQPLD